ncbi:hypothetical protein IOD16_18335 [Saccharothrix sp. 6-C]|uniref:hypothetical protein n=1 Tax=Saccharothrix sp. 6-C TaxID=2781735 RepID=UPI0019174C33|nr:hypothetical protein [Saccharothrix sp. 6-C]QQQ80168.1 hypothetical protein IOD16_18335 [Saccharothrix sp. 6-C]
MTKKSTSVIAALGVTAAMVGTPSTTQAQSADHNTVAISCYAVADEPWYRSPSVYATGHIYCNPWADAEITVKITANGALKGESSTGYTAPHITDTAVAQNWTGDQKWCTLVSGTYYVNGRSYPVSATACESAGF